MSSAIKILPSYTYEDYCHWEGNWELIDGFPFAMSPAPTPRHQNVSVNLGAEFRYALKNSSCKCIAYSPIDYKVEENTILQPDILIVCDPISKKFLDFPPVLVAEILSPATMLKDRNTKFHIYQSQKIKYYLLIDADKNEIEIFELDANTGEYKVVSFSPEKPFNFQLTDGCNVEVTLQNIWS